MATWHQNQRPVRLYDPVRWNVVIDPPNAMRSLVSFDTREQAENYMRGLHDNNPGCHQYAYILGPMKQEQ